MNAVARTLGWIAIVTPLFISGCATTPYRYGGTYYTDKDVALKPGEPQIERGQRRPIIDAFGWLIGLPSKVLMLNPHIDNHNVSPETELYLQEYLVKNKLDKVKVRVNEYDPVGEWQRLIDNDSMWWPVRCTFGVVSVTGYVILPGRIWGGDNYNPYTNTIYLYSDVPYRAMFEGAAAKYYAGKKYKGLNAMLDGGISRNFYAASDVMGYIRDNGNAKDMRNGYLSVAPTVASECMPPVVEWFAPTVVLPVVAAGHVAGAAQAATVKDSDFAAQRRPSNGPITASYFSAATASNEVHTCEIAFPYPATIVDPSGRVLAEPAPMPNDADVPAFGSPIDPATIAPTTTSGATPGPTTGSPSFLNDAAPAFSTPDMQPLPPVEP